MPETFPSITELSTSPAPLTTSSMPRSWEYQYRLKIFCTGIERHLIQNNYFSRVQREYETVSAQTSDKANAEIWEVVLAAIFGLMSSS